MSSTHNPGRVAGFWYLLLVIIGPLRLTLYSQQTLRAGNATASGRDRPIVVGRGLSAIP
jgi:hypothetical protein